jgi:uncharacterized repeat protein (TIGR03803 family)
MKTCLHSTWLKPSRLCWLIFLIAFSSKAQTPALWGMTSKGGTDGLGTIYKTNPDGSGLVVQRSFTYSLQGRNNGERPQLVQTANGKMYGTTNQGGTNDQGTLFEYDPATGVATTKKADFGLAVGSYPLGGLVLAASGKLYGVTATGGTFDAGVIFEYDPATNVYTKKFDFDNTNTNGYIPSDGLINHSNGKMYGITRAGVGPSSNGVLYEYDPATNTYTKKANLNVLGGSEPTGRLMQATNGKLYGALWSGGASSIGDGVLFEYDAATNVLTKKIDFAAATSGQNPTGSFVQASNGKIYGTTVNGGSSGVGVLFEYDPVGNTIVKKVDFASTIGIRPNSGMLKAANGNLYGLISQGGLGSGVLYEFDPATSTYAKKFDFDVTNSAANKGRQPTGSLIQGSNGKLYGTTVDGGSAYEGVLFEYDITSNAYLMKVEFSGTPLGKEPLGSLMQASNSKLYGMTSRGGANDAGVLFEYNPTSSSFTKKHDFTETAGYPSGSLVQAGNGKLYGLTESGGPNGFGTLFEFDPATDVFTKKYDLTGANGINPYGSLILATNGKLYGMTAYGGVNDEGVIFEYDPATNVYAKKIDFNTGSGGYQPEGDMMQATNGKIFGMTRFGGTNDKGVIFEYDIATNTITKRVDFTGANGETPTGSLTQAANGKLYGMTERGGANTIGVLFEYDPTTNVYTKKLDFNGTTNGGTPNGSLELSSNGKLYGFTTSGGANNFGVLFEYDAVANNYTKKQDFAGANGANPYKGSLLYSYCTVPAKPVISVTNANTATPTLTSSSTIGNQWYLNGASIGGATSSTYQVTQAGIYKVQVKDDVCLSEFSTDQSFVTQTITFGVLADKVLGDAPFALTGTTTSGLPLSYSSSSNKITITGSQVSLISAGRLTITASQPGAIGFLQAVSVNQSFCIKPAKPTVALSATNPASPILTSSATSGNQWFRNGTLIAGATNSTFNISQAGIYKVQVQVDDCISAFSDDQPIIVTAVEPMIADRVSVYPNPAQDVLTIDLGGFEKNQTVFVSTVDMLGRPLNQLTGEGGGEVKMDVRSFVPGQYIIQLQQGKNSATESFIKN